MPIPDHAELSDALNRGGASWTPAPNPLTALGDEDRQALLGVVVNREEVEAALAEPARDVSAPPGVDWRNVAGVSYVTPVKDQLGCGSCVSFGCCACLEAMTLIRRGETVDLSEADLHFCSAHGPSCGGWWPSNALVELQSRGTPDEGCFPYLSAFDPAGNPSCNTCPDRDGRAYKAAGSTVLATMDERKAWLASNGPVCAVFHVYDDFWGYGTGVYRHVMGAHAGYHAVAIVGYSDAEGCWIAKNSWGPAWGEHGFFKIAYGECGIDETSTDTDPSGSVNQFPMWGIDDVVVPALESRSGSWWSGWESRGGILIAGPAAASWDEHRLDVFVTGFDNAMWHTWWDGGAWHGSESLGGIIDGPPAAVSWGPNRIDCFARGIDNRLYHRWWDGNAWQGWASLGGVITSGPAASARRKNRLDVFAKGIDNALWHLWWNGSAWQGWESLGGVIDDAPAAVSPEPERVECFVRGDDNRLHHRQWAGGAWQDWEDLGGSILSGPAVSSWGKDRLDVFAKGTDSTLWHLAWDGSAWQEWESLGGTIDDAPAAVSWGPNRIDVFARSIDNTLLHKWYA